jgi:hypothetical protein
MMKKILIIIILFYFNTDGMTQGWAPPGAMWLYEQPGLGDIRRHYQISYTKDTIINNTPTKELEVHTIYYQFTPIGILLSGMNYHTSWFMYENNGTVYWWNNGQFKPLYVFTPQVGDSWQISKPSDSYHPCDSISSQDSIVVDSITTQIIDGHTYTRINTSSIGDKWTMRSYYKNIGGRSNFVPIAENSGDTCFYFDQSVDYSGSLLCYYDDIRGYRNIFPGGQECNLSLMTNTKKISDVSNTSVSIYPNPVSDVINIKNDKEENFFNRLTISNVLGQVVVEKEFSNALSVDFLPKGIYILTLYSQNNITSSTKFIKQ